jgi:type II secretory pathway component PulF
MRQPGTRRWFGGLVLKTPRLADLYRSLTTARMARMLGVLLESKVSLMESLQLTRNSMTHIHYVELLEQAEEAVSRGEPVSAILATSPLVHPSVGEAIRNGEQSGQMGAPLIHMADFLDEENELLIKALSRLLEPTILVFLGVMVGLMALSMFLPLFDLVSSASGGGK